MFRKNKKTDQFHENFTYNLDSFAKKRNMRTELSPVTPKAIETVNDYFQANTDLEMSKMRLPPHQFGAKHLKKKTKYNAYVNAQFNSGVYIHPGWDKLWTN